MTPSGSPSFRLAWDVSARSQKMWYKIPNNASEGIPIWPHRGSDVLASKNSALTIEFFSNLLAENCHEKRPLHPPCPIGLISFPYASARNTYVSAFQPSLALPRYRAGLMPPAFQILGGTSRGSSSPEHDLAWRVRSGRGMAARSSTADWRTGSGSARLLEPSDPDKQRHTLASELEASPGRSPGQKLKDGFAITQSIYLEGTGPAGGCGLRRPYGRFGLAPTRRRNTDELARVHAQGFGGESPTEIRPAIRRVRR
jgi:hypothetical protein